MFKRFFDAGNPLMQGLAIAADLLFLNLLTLVCCLPVFTAGAALTALSDLAQQLVRGEETYVLRGYFRSFRSNFKKGCLLGLIFLGAAALVWLDYRVALAVMPVMRFAAAAVGVLVLAAAIYAFALQARFENSLGGTLKNALALVPAYFPVTLGMVVCTLALWIIALRFINYALPVMLMFGLSLPAYVCAQLYKGVFEKLAR